MADLRITDTQGYLLYREVEPVQPYPRIDPQQPHDEKPRGQDQTREKKDGQPRRRFVAMRQLIDRLKEIGQLERVDYPTLVKDLGTIGIAHADKELFELLQTHQVTIEGLNHLAVQIRALMASPDVGFGPPLMLDTTSCPISAAVWRWCSCAIFIWSYCRGRKDRCWSMPLPAMVPFAVPPGIYRWIFNRKSKPSTILPSKWTSALWSP